MASLNNLSHADDNDSEMDLDSGEEDSIDSITSAQAEVFRKSAPPQASPKVIPGPPVPMINTTAGPKPLSQLEDQKEWKRHHELQDKRLLKLFGGGGSPASLKAWHSMENGLLAELPHLRDSHLYMDLKSRRVFMACIGTLFERLIQLEKQVGVSQVPTSHITPEKRKRSKPTEVPKAPKKQATQAEDHALKRRVKHLEKAINLQKQLNDLAGMELDALEKRDHKKMKVIDLTQEPEPVRIKEEPALPEKEDKVEQAANA